MLDSRVDADTTIVGCWIPLTREFCVYAPPCPLEAIEAEIEGLEREIVEMLKGITT